MTWIDISNRGNNFKFKLTNKITLIVGDSAMGKTLFYEAVRSNLRRQYNKQNFVLIDKSTVSNAIYLIRNSIGAVIIVDEAQLVLTPEIANEINIDENNKYIIMGRGARLDKLNTTVKCIREIEYNREKRLFTLTFPFYFMEEVL